MMTMIEPASKKQIEQRSCIGCRRVRHKSELIRCVKCPTGEVILDRDGRAQGRGAYLCRSFECFAKAKKKRLFNRAFKVSVDESLYDELEQMISSVP